MVFVLHSLGAFCQLPSDWLCALKFFDYLQKFNSYAVRLYMVEHTLLQKLIASTIGIRKHHPLIMN
jgi:hypothetical protein